MNLQIGKKFHKVYILDFYLHSRGSNHKSGAQKIMSKLRVKSFFLKILGWVIAWMLASLVYDIRFYSQLNNYIGPIFFWVSFALVGAIAGAIGGSIQLWQLFRFLKQGKQE